MTLSPYRRLLLAILLAPLVPMPPAHAATVPGPERTVVYLNEDDPRIRNALNVLRATLARSGVTARHNVHIDHVVVDMWKPAEITAALKKALQSKPAIIIAPNSEVAALAKALTADVPIIFASHQDPIRIGLIASLARPGGNLTGFTFFVPVDEKRLELLRQLAPRVRKLGIVIDRWWLEESGGSEVAPR